MFNVIVGGAYANGAFNFWPDRVVEHTTDEIRERFSREGALDFTALMTLPTLFMDEGIEQQLAHIGSVTAVREIGRRDLRIEYTLDLGMPTFTSQSLYELRHDLGLSAAQFTRTHWAVKDGDLCRTLLRRGLRQRIGPQVFHLPEHEAVEEDLVSVMMPFSQEFDGVYDVLTSLCGELNLRCQRADNVWENDVVLDDIVSLIDRSRVVIADCTGRNANVFYEMGIAHSLGRSVVMITQSRADIPFDVNHRRYATYLNNNEGLVALQQALRARIAGLAG